MQVDEKASRGVVRCVVQCVVGVEEGTMGTKGDKKGGSNNCTKGELNTRAGRGTRGGRSLFLQGQEGSMGGLLPLEGLRLLRLGPGRLRWARLERSS